MPARVGKQPQNLRREISPNVRKGTRDDLVKALTDGERKKANQAIEFVEKITSATSWTLDDWAELVDLATAGRFFHEIRLAFTEVEETGAVAVSKEEYEEE